LYFILFLRIGHLLLHGGSILSLTGGFNYHVSWFPQTKIIMLVGNNLST